MNWKVVSIDEIKSTKKYSLVGGPFGSDLSGIHYVDFGVPVIRGTNLPFDMKFSSEDFVYVSEEKANKLNSNTAYPGDLIFTQRGTLGQVGIVPFGKFERYIISQSQMKLTLDSSKTDPLFLYYYFRTKECLTRIENLAFSTGVPHINLGILKNFKIPYPPLPTQRKIASILSAYDELIENNKQRIRLLEEMAEEIYKEWFVRLRFPGYETTKFFDEDGKEISCETVGAMPEGWTQTRLETICDFQMGQSPLSEFYNEDGQGLPFHQGVTNFNSRFPNHVTYCTDLKRIADKGDILLSVRAPVGRINIATTKLVIGRGLSSVKHKKALPNYCYYLLKEIFKKEDSFGNGAVFNAVTKNDLLRIKLNEPSFEVCKKFQDLIQPIDDEIKVLTDKNQLLQQTRDLLLPRLISGKLSVEHLVEEQEAGLSIAAEPEVNYQFIK